jgi:hypothetical protein
VGIDGLIMASERNRETENFVKAMKRYMSKANNLFGKKYNADAFVILFRNGKWYIYNSRNSIDWVRIDKLVCIRKGCITRSNRIKDQWYPVPTIYSPTKLP